MEHNTTTGSPAPIHNRTQFLLANNRFQEIKMHIARQR